MILKRASKLGTTTLHFANCFIATLQGIDCTRFGILFSRRVALLLFRGEGNLKEDIQRQKELAPKATAQVKPEIKARRSNTAEDLRTNAAPKRSFFKR